MRSVASSAASESLSMRSARASGCRRQAAIASALPARMPGLRAAEQLVAGEADEIAAVAQRLARERLAGQLGRLEQRPEPTS